MTIKANDCVLNCTLSSGEIVSVTPRTFDYMNFAGAKVKGNAYYVNKAVKLGATKIQVKKKQA